MEARPFLCSICFKPIDAKMYKIDEEGWAMHEECYAILVQHRPKKSASVGLLSRVFAKIVRH